MNGRQIALIAKYSTRYSVRGGIGLVFLLLSLSFGLLVAHTMLQPVEMVVKQISEQNENADKDELTEMVLDRLVDEAAPVVSWMLSSSSTDDDEETAAAKAEAADAWAEYLLEERPAVLSAIFLILLFGWPFIVAIGAFDIYAGDIGSRQLRYQLLRVDRGSIFFGRLLGMLATFALVLFLLAVTVVLYMGVKLPMYGWGELITWALQGMAAILFVSIPYVAFCAWVSASIGSSFAALTISKLVIAGVPLFATFGSYTHEAAGYVRYLLPWGVQTSLLHHDWGQLLLAGSVCLVQTALFTWLGYRKFTRRDL